jgi:hypothetical protein
MTTLEALYARFEEVADDGVLTIEPGYVETRRGSVPGVRLLAGGKLVATFSRRRFLRGLQVELLRDFTPGEELILEPDVGDEP